MGKGYNVHLRREEVELLNLVARHRMMEPRTLAQDLLTLGILAEIDKLKAIFGDDWKNKIKQGKKGVNYE